MGVVAVAGSWFLNQWIPLKTKEQKKGVHRKSEWFLSPKSVDDQKHVLQTWYFPILHFGRQANGGGGGGYSPHGYATDNINKITTTILTPKISEKHKIDVSKKVLKKLMTSVNCKTKLYTSFHKSNEISFGCNAVSFA